MKTEIEQAIASACKDLFGERAEVALTRPDEQFGDYATNVALQLAQKLNKNPRDVAEKLKTSLEGQVSEISVAGPGFLNIKITDEVLWQLANQKPSKTMEGKTVLVEYLDPNPFKEIHIGHAYSGTVGDAIASLFSAAGANVHRVTYQGDVGRHVAQSLYGILQQTEIDPGVLDKLKPADRAEFLGKAYAAGATAYEQDESARQQIVEINKKVYDRSDSEQNVIYDTCKKWSLEYFDQTYSILGLTPFEKNYMESEIAADGKSLTLNHISDGVFEESDGAVVFKGEQFGLHTRVFINSAGLPTYEAKDLGNAARKWNDYHYDRSIIITGQEQAEYFKVMLKALEQFEPQQARSTTHIPHGIVKLNTGKMSSRTGKILRATEVLDQIMSAAKEINGQEGEDGKVRDISLAAMKYAFLKNRIGGDVAFDINESVALEGNSGPYLQYAHARARSILSKVDIAQTSKGAIEAGERSLVRKIGEYAEVVDKAVGELMPHHICTYLYELAQVFNRFYENNRVVGDEREAVRVRLVQLYADVLQNGLKLLNIPAPEKM